MFLSCRVDASALEEVPMAMYQISGAPVSRSGFSFASQPSSTSITSTTSSASIQPRQSDGQPLEKVFSFDSFANSFSLPTDQRQSSQQGGGYYQQGDASYPLPHPQEGKALARITDSIEDVARALRPSKRARTGDEGVDVDEEDTAVELEGAPLQRRSSSGVSLPHLNSYLSSLLLHLISRVLLQVPLARLDSLESTLASLLDFDEEGNMIRLDSVDLPTGGPPGEAASSSSS
jgi:hypothetical protein